MSGVLLSHNGCQRWSFFFPSPEIPSEIFGLSCADAVQMSLGVPEGWGSDGDGPDTPRFIDWSV